LLLLLQLLLLLTDHIVLSSRPNCSRSHWFRHKANLSVCTGDYRQKDNIPHSSLSPNRQGIYLLTCLLLPLNIQSEDMTVWLIINFSLCYTNFWKSTSHIAVEKLLFMLPVLHCTHATHKKLVTSALFSAVIAQWRILSVITVIIMNVIIAELL